MHLPLLGDHQMENASLAIAAVEALQQRGLDISRDHIVQGLCRVRWPARLQILQQAPLLVIDGAHNAYSIQALTESVKRYFPYKKLYLIFGSSSDKDIGGMANSLAGLPAKVFVTRSGHPRAASVDQLARTFRQHGIPVEIQLDVREALSAALAVCGNDDLILATGSLFIAAETTRQFKSGNLR